MFAESITSLHRRSGRLVVFLKWPALLVAWLMLVKLPMDLPYPNVDSSWRTVLDYGALHGWRWGVDIIINFGPLGYLYAPIYSQDNWISALIFQSLHVAFYLCLLLRLVCAEMRRDQKIVLCFLGVLAPSLSTDSVFFLSILFSGLLLYRPNRRDFVLGLVGVAFTAIASTIKVTFLIEAVLMLGCLCLHGVLTRSWRRPVLAVFVYLAGFALVWTVWAGQQVIHIPDFLRGASQITAAYGEAMGILAPMDLLFAGFVFLCLVSGLLVARCFSKSGRKEIAPTILLLGTLFLGWKQGFTRGDLIHVPTFFAVGIVILSLVCYLFQSGREQGNDTASAVAVMLVAVAACASLSAGARSHIFVGNVKKLRWIAAATHGTKRLESIAREAGERYQLPEIKKAVGDRPVDIAGIYQAYASLNHLNYRPPPVFQAYQAATAELIQKNSDFYRSSLAPEFVLVQMRSVDGRFPTLDNSLVFLEMTQKYRPVLYEEPFLLLQRREDAPVPAAKTLQSSGEVRLGEKIPIPEGRVWCEIDVRDSFIGRAFRFFLHTPAIPLETTARGDNESKSWRLIPSEARAGFLISPIVATNADFLDLYDADGKSVESVSIRPTRLVKWVLQPKIGYRIYSLPSSGLVAPVSSDVIGQIREELKNTKPVNE